MSRQPLPGVEPTWTPPAPAERRSPGAYRKQGVVDRGEPDGFPLVPPVQGVISTHAILAADPDVVRLEEQSARKEARIRALRLVIVAVGLGLLFAVCVAVFR